MSTQKHFVWTSIVRTSLMLILILAVSTPAAAQSGSGVAAIEGIVTDPDNRPMPGTVVLIVSTATGYERAVYADARGRYFSSSMPVGTYSVQASAPGFTTLQQESDRNGLVISGQRSINSNIAIDGSDFNDALQGNQRGGNDSVFFFPQAAVLEFQVVRSGATAEVGRTNSGFINVVTKSGANNVHGEGFYYDRERSLSSPDAFGRKLNNQQSQFGDRSAGRSGRIARSSSAPPSRAC